MNVAGLRGGVELNFCWYQSADDPRHPEQVDPLLQRGRYTLADHPLKFVTQYAFDNTLSKDVQCERRMEEGGRELQMLAQRGMILPTELMPVIRANRDAQDPDGKIFSNRDLTAPALLEVLKDKTQKICEGKEPIHKVAVLVFEPERYAAYLQQASRNFKKPSDEKCVIH